MEKNPAQKWVKQMRNFQAGDIALLKVFSAQNHWLVCKVINTNPDDKGIVCSVTLCLGSSGGSNKEQVLTRTITKIFLVLEAAGIDSETKGALDGG